MGSDRALQERLDRLASRGEPRGANTVLARAEAASAMEDVAPFEHRRRSRPGWFVAAGIAALAVIVVIVVLFTGGPSRREPVTNPPDTQYEGDGLVLEDATHGPELCAGIVRTSLPPRCDGIRLTNWSWERLPGVETMSGTTWGSFHVVGTYDGGGFTVEDASAPALPGSRTDGFNPDFSPACSDPEVIDPTVNVFEWEAATQDLPPLLIPNLAAMWVTDTPGKYVVNVVVRPGASAEATQLIRARWPGFLCVVERDQPTEAELNAVQNGVQDVVGQMVWLASADHRKGVVYALVTVVDDTARDSVDRAFGPGVVELSGVLTPTR